jgi:hypothetical protein
VVSDLQKTFAVLLLSVSAATHAAGRAASEPAPARAGADAPVGGGAMAGTTSPEEGLLGAWSGEHVSLVLTAQGGTVELDCAHGEIARAIVPDRSGRFDVPGTHVEERGGPAREGAPPLSLDVRYSGRVKDGRMKLSVTRVDTKARLGTFTLDRGREPSLVKCR